MPSALEILNSKEEFPKSFLSDIWAPVSCGTFGFALACFINWGTRRPVFSGVQKHIALTGVGALLGRYFENRQSVYLAERDAVLRHYIQLHEEDFQLPERKKWGELFNAWIPIR